MKKNMALMDRFLRLVLAVIAIYYVLSGTPVYPWNMLLIVAAIIFIFTGIVGSCPLYTVFGIDTRQFKESRMP